MIRPSMSRALSPLRHRPFRLLVTGQVASNLGDACYAVALPWYVLAGHGGTVLLATVLAAYGIPRTAAIPIGGYLSDRWRPQTVMLATGALRALAVAALALAAAAGPARATELVPIAVVLGAGEGLFLPGSFSSASRTWTSRRRRPARSTAATSGSGSSSPGCRQASSKPGSCPWPPRAASRSWPSIRPVPVY